VSQSPSQSPSTSGYPVRVVIDNTAGASTMLSLAAPFDALAAGAVSGVSWRFLEEDATCGPGVYDHLVVTVALAASPCNGPGSSCCDDVQAELTAEIYLVRERAWL
jgi:hypothetical protein